MARYCKSIGDVTADNWLRCSGAPTQEFGPLFTNFTCTSWEPTYRRLHRPAKAKESSRENPSVRTVSHGMQLSSATVSPPLSVCVSGCSSGSSANEQCCGRCFGSSLQRHPCLVAVGLAAGTESLFSLLLSGILQDKKKTLNE